MKRRLVTMLLVGMFLVTAHGVCLGDNLLGNGDFEIVGPDMTPDGWSVTPARNTDFNTSFDDTDKITGSYSFRINVENSAGRVPLMPEAANIGIPEPGKTYELSFQAKAEDLAISGMMVAPVVRLDFRPTRTRPTPMIDLVSETNINQGWEEVSIQATAPDDAQHVVLHITLTQGTVWLDDFSLTPID